MKAATSLKPAMKAAVPFCAALLLLGGGLVAQGGAASSMHEADGFGPALSGADPDRSVTSGPADFIRVQTLVPTLDGPNDTNSVQVRFGHSVSVDRNWVLVGMPERVNLDTAIAGGAFFFERSGSPLWQLNRRWLIEDRFDYQYRCGRSVAMLARPGRSEPWVPNERAQTGVIGCPRGQINEGYAFIESQIALPDSMIWGNAGAPAGAPNHRCGTAVALAGTGLIGETFLASSCVGRGPAQTNGSRGEVDIHRFVGTPGPDFPTNQRWELDTTLVYDAAQLPAAGVAWDFGHSVSMHRSSAGLLRVAVGMPGINSGAGMVLVFERAAGATGSFTEVARLLRPGANQTGAQFGFSVAIDGNHLVVGAPGERGTLDSDGRVHAYQRNLLTGAWQLAATINPSNLFNNQDGSRFGHAVALSGTELWVGQPYWRNDAGNTRGRARRYTRAGGGLDPVSYGLRQSFTDTGIGTFNEGEFGWSVSVDATTGTAAIGYPLFGTLANPGRRWGSAWVLRVDRIHANGFGCVSNCP